MSNMAWPKTIVNKNYVRQKITNRINEVIEVDADNVPLANMYMQTQPSNMAGYVIKAIELAIDLTREMMGVSDAALGDASAENTSAIMVLQKASDRPLENIQANLYQFVEDIGYIWDDFICSKYVVPRDIPTLENGMMEMFSIEPSKLSNTKFHIKIDVGPSSYWSEAASIETLDNLKHEGIINAVQLLERYPEGTIPRKAELIEELKAEMEAAKQAAALMPPQQQTPIQ
jgi:hypothetical protein